MRFLILICLFVLSVRSAQALEIPCDRAPPSAALTLPDPFASWGRVMCTPYGHMIAAKEPAWWLLPGNKPMLILAADAKNVDPDQVIEHLAHFASLSARKIGFADVKRVDAAFRAAQARPDPAPVRHLFGLDIATADGRSLVWYLFRGAPGPRGSGLWGILCAAEVCAPDFETLTGIPFEILSSSKK